MSVAKLLARENTGAKFVYTILRQIPLFEEQDDGSFKYPSKFG